jgi:DNA-binding HxlR family transcriptional regulator
MPGMLGAVNGVIRMTGELDPRGSWTATRCSLARAAEVIHTRSALLVMREAFYGATRFEEFAERTGLSEPVASARLRELVEAGMLRRVPYREPGARTRDGYALTPMGADFLPALVALMQWGDRWLQPDGGPIELRHDDCGAPVAAELRCGNGHAVRELSAVRTAASSPADRPDADSQ